MAEALGAGVPRPRHFRALACSLVAGASAIAGCGSGAQTATANNPTLSVDSSDTYAYSFYMEGCSPIGVPIYGGPTCAMGLTSDSGTTLTLLAASSIAYTNGSASLSAGNWTTNAGLEYVAAQKPMNCGTDRGAPLEAADGNWFCPLGGVWTFTLTKPTQGS
jgi:hypothetical protein